MLPFRFTMEGIRSIDQANVYLQNEFMPYFNTLFGYDCDYVNGRMRKIDSAFVPCTADEIRNSLAVLCERTVNKGCSIQLDSSFFALLDPVGKRIALPYHTKVTVARLLDGSVYAARGEHCYTLQKIPDRHAFSKLVDPEQIKPKASRPKAPATHPWSFQRQMKFRQNDAMMKNLEPYYKSSHERRYA